MVSSNGAHADNQIDNTAPGNEAVLKCNSGNYCCDANRPDVGGGIGCCDTSSDFFALPAGNLISFIGNAAAATSTPKPATEPSATQLTSQVVQTSSISTTSSSSSDPSTTTTSTGSSSGAPQNNGIVGTPSRADTSVVIITSVVVNSASSISSTIILTTAAPKSTATASNPPSTQTSSPKNLGIKIGVGVGVPVGVLALAALTYFLWRRQKKRSAPSSMNYVPPTDLNQIEYMYKNNADLDSPYTATIESPEVDQRASGNTFSMGSGPGEYRGVSTAGLGMHPTTSELPDSPSRLSELSGSSPRQREFRNSQMSSPRQRDFRNSQMSELAGSSRQPSELP